MQIVTVVPGTHKSLGSISNMITQRKVVIESARVQMNFKIIMLSEKQEHKRMGWNV